MPKPDLWTKSLPLAFAAILAFGAVSSEALGQQTIINVPSDDLTPKGQQFVLHESVILPRKASGDYQSTNFYTFGLSKRTELAATLYNVDNAGSSDMSLGLGFKSVFPVLRERAPLMHTKWTVGHMVPISLQPSSPSVGFFSYSHLAFDIPNTDLRLLGGVAGGSRNVWGETTASAIAGVEYPLTDHLSFTGEWFSGTHNFSGLIPGFTYHNDDLIVVGGFKIPNNFEPRDYGVVLELGLFFGGKAGDGHEEEDEDEAPRHYGTRPPRRNRPGRY